ncbi:MAG TPA: hypothetical protein VEA61_00715 [Allosphingosinicella sp.]|nr:hypothetical protein [Allosphingosinicella sp.]
MAKRDEQREKRLAEALRENLRRRKAQARGVEEEAARHPGQNTDFRTGDLAPSQRGPGLRRDDD